MPIFRGKLEVLAVLGGDLGATEIPDFLSLLGLEHRGFAHHHEHAWQSSQLANGLQGTVNPTAKSQTGTENRSLESGQRLPIPSKPGVFCCQLTILVPICCFPSHDYFQKI